MYYIFSIKEFEPDGKTWRVVYRMITQDIDDGYTGYIDYSAN